MDERPERPLAFEGIEDEDHPALRWLIGPLLGFGLGAMAGLVFGVFQLALPWIMLPEPGKALLAIAGFFALAGTIAGAVASLLVNAGRWAVWALRSRRRRGAGCSGIER